MSNAVSLFYWSDKVQRAESRVSEMVFDITGAKAVNELQGFPVLSTFDAIASQAVIDAYLGTTNEFLAAQFDATAMGANVFAGIMNLGGQAADILYMTANLRSGTGLPTLEDATSKLLTGDLAAKKGTLASSSLMTADTVNVQLGANGNVAFSSRFATAGIDALSSGILVVKIYWKSK